ncbi:hypothetical protein AMECASPLE_019381, partial [Ameca splendens]
SYEKQLCSITCVPHPAQISHPFLPAAFLGGPKCKQELGSHMVGLKYLMITELVTYKGENRTRSITREPGDETGKNRKANS